MSAHDHSMAALTKYVSHSLEHRQTPREASDLLPPLLATPAAPASQEGRSTSGFKCLQSQLRHVLFSV